MTTAHRFGYKRRGAIHTDEKTSLGTSGELKSNNSTPFSGKENIEWGKLNHLNNPASMLRKLYMLMDVSVHLVIRLSLASAEWYKTALSQDL